LAGRRVRASTKGRFSGLKVDLTLANACFNVSHCRGELLKGDKRSTFGVPVLGARVEPMVRQFTTEEAAPLSPGSYLRYDDPPARRLAEARPKRAVA